MSRLRGYYAKSQKWNPKTCLLLDHKGMQVLLFNIHLPVLYFGKLIWTKTMNFACLFPSIIRKTYCQAIFSYHQDALSVTGQEQEKNTEVKVLAMHHQVCSLSINPGVAPENHLFVCTPKSHWPKCRGSGGRLQHCCSGLTPAFMPRKHFWQDAEDHMQFWGSNENSPNVRQVL